jgi:transketolase
MRGQILDALFSLMESNRDIFFLTADMGIGLVERFESRYPDRYLNVGIAEQNLIGVAAGLVNMGYRPFVYTISNFAVERCFEQIRNDICIHRYPITILGTSCGYDNAPLGPTHHILDDWGALGALPGLDIYCPSSKKFAATLVQRILKSQRPAYVRIPKGSPEEPALDDLLVTCPGTARKTVLVSYGNPAQECLKAREIDPRMAVVILNQLHPLPEELAAVLGSYTSIIVVEDHFPDHGLFGAICRLATISSLKGKVQSLAPKDYSLEVGVTPGYYHGLAGMDAKSILSIAGGA